MNDIWSIIGLSSLVASVVTVILGIIRDFLVEEYRFKRESEAGYIQSQIQLYSRIYFGMKRISGSRVSKLSELFGKWQDEVKEINDIMKAKADLLEQRVRDNWLDIWSLAWDYKMETDEEKMEELNQRAKKLSKELSSIIVDIMNNDLIPKYRKIVGETVPDLD